MAGGGAGLGGAEEASLEEDAPAAALEGACRREDLTLVRSLLGRGADASATLASGKGTLLHLAAGVGKAQLVSLLLSHRANIDAVSSEGVQAVHVAARTGALAALAELWRYDGTVLCRGDREGSTPAHHAAQGGRVHVLEWLYLRGVPVNSQDSFGFSPLHYAVHAQRPLASQLLVRCGVGALGADMKGRTPLHWAALKGCSGLVDAAVKIRPDALGGLQACRARDAAGRTPRQLSWCRCSDPCMPVQLGDLEAWLQTRRRVSPLIRHGLQRLRPCHPCLTFGALLLPLLHALSAALLLLLALPKLWEAAALGPESTLLAAGQLLSQLLSLRLWASASCLDPGVCQPTARMDAEEQGPDGHERLVAAVQSELNELLRRRWQLLGGPGPPEGPEAEKRGLRAIAEELDASISAGKERLADALRQASAARLAFYPADYASLAFAAGTEADPSSWGKRACVVCGRLRSHRSKHCRECGRCVARFDHHCPWLGNCVGAGNVVQFVRFLAWTFIALSLSQLMSWQLLEDLPAPLEGWSPWWRLCIKANFVANIIWTIFVGALLVRQVGLGMVDATEYEVDQRGGLLELLRLTPRKKAMRNLMALLIQEPRGGKSNEAADDLELGVAPSALDGKALAV